MSILIKGLKMPKEDELLCIRIYPSGKVTVDMDLQCKQVAEAVEVLNHGDLIDRDALNATDSWDWIRHDAPVVIAAERSE